MKTVGTVYAIAYNGVQFDRYVLAIRKILKSDDYVFLPYSKHDDTLISRVSPRRNLVILGCCPLDMAKIVGNRLELDNDTYILDDCGDIKLLSRKDLI